MMKSTCKTKEEFEAMALGGTIQGVLKATQWWDRMPKRKPMIIPASNILDAYSHRSQYRNRKPLIWY
jgi:hypothetical protein